MHITQIDLVNVKSYAQVSVSFAPGTNAIFGQNGAGKSTLLEAIGFALFHHLDVNNAEFVREGERTATVTVHVLGADERVYHVVRKAGSSSQAYVYDPELEERLVEGVTDTRAWLQDFLGVEPDTNLSALFRDAVGVPQGLLTAAFLLTAASRKGVFNPLLRVDEYERAWRGLRDAGGWLARELQACETRIAGFSAEVKVLPDRRAEVARLVAAIDEGEQRQETVASEWIQVEKRKAALEEVKGRLDKLERVILRSQSQVDSLVAQLEQAQVAVAGAERARVVVEETRAGHEAYGAAQTAQTSLEAERRERDRLRAELQAVEGKLARERDRLAVLAERLEAVAEAEDKLAALRPGVVEQERLEAALVAARRNEDRLAAARSSLTRQEERLARLRARLDEVRSGLSARHALAAEVAGAQEVLAPLDDRATVLAAALAATGAERDTLAGQQRLAGARLAQAGRDLAAEEASLRALEDRVTAGRRELEARARVEAQVAGLREELDALDGRRLGLSKEATAFETELNQVLKQLDALEAAAVDPEGEPRCPVCEEPLTPEHYEELVARGRHRLNELQAEMSRAKRELQSVERARRTQEKALHAAEADLGALPRPAEVEELEAGRERHAQAVRDRRTALEREQAAVATLEVQQAELAAALTGLRGEQTVLEGERAAVRQALDALERQLESLPRPAEAEQLASDITRQESAVAEEAQTIAGLAGAPEEGERLAAELVSLGDPRGAARVAAATAEKRPIWEGQQAEAASSRDAWAAAQATAIEALAAYEGMDERLAEVREAVRTHTPDHERYLRAADEAGSLGARQATADRLHLEHVSALETLAARTSEREEVARDYDAGEAARVMERAGALQAELSELEGRLNVRRERLAEVQAEVEQLEGVQAELDAALVAQADLEGLQALLEQFRYVLRDAGPRITAALVGLVSNGADLVYSQIMQADGGQNSAGRLRWTNDYEIVLLTQGRERTFQQLSGGEQMAAALAVRLALLRQISAVDVAFFDEPTANLDRERRSNLAAQILSVKGFSQLFVISHDDTFEQDTDHVVHIVKENGMSRVEEP